MEPQGLFLNSPARIIGVGSPHGNDRIGWLLVESLEDFGAEFDRVVVRRPIDLIDHVKSVDTVIVVDACQSGNAAGSFTRIDWPDPRLEMVSERSTHGLDLVATLALLDSLGRLPRRVVLLAVEVVEGGPASSLSPALLESWDLIRNRFRALIRSILESPSADLDHYQPVTLKSLVATAVLEEPDHEP